MFDRAKPWFGLSGSRRVLVKVWTAMVVCLGMAFAVLVSVVSFAAALPAGGYGTTAFQATGFAASVEAGLALWFILALVGLVVLAASWKGAKMSHRVIGAGIVVFLWALVIIGAAAMVPGTGPQGGPPTATALNMTITPATDTTASYPAGSWTACTSQSVLSSNGAKTLSGVVATNMTYQSAGPMSGTFIRYTGDTGAVTGGGGKMGANCFQMKFTFAYTNAPPASGGGSVYFPVFVFLTGVTYTAPASNLNNQPFNTAYNNGTIVNVPIFAQSTVGLGSFPVLVKDGAGNWQEVCPNLRNTNLQTAGALPACAGINVNQNPTTNSITFTLDVITNMGIFGYATTDAGVGSTLTLTFSVGLPQAQALPGYGSYYTPNLATYSLQIQRTGA